MRHRPADAGRPRFDIAEIVREHRAALEAQVCLSPEQRRVLTDVAQCRTAVLGGHVDSCASCGYEQPSYNSCRNRHCPKCQALAQEAWIAERSEQLLDEGHFHLVFTVPSELRSLVKFAPALLYDALFVASAATLQQLAAERLGAKLGVTMVLHTWTRDLRFHPHVHAIVTGGGLALDGTRWISRGGKFLFHVGVMGSLLRGKMMAALRRLHKEGRFQGFEAFRDPEGFDTLLAKLAKHRWVVYAKAPFRKSRHVVAYLGRYTHRVGIANSRLLAVSPDAVTFRTRDDATETLHPVEFLRRFTQHVLPDGFHKTRHYGLYASGAKTAHAIARSLLGQRPSRRRKPRPVAELLLDLLGRDISLCPQCGAPLSSKPLPVPQARSPPEARLA